jgi:hypothetical protein
MEPQAPDAATGTPKQQVADRINRATNILVTVSNNPTVDQMAACLGFTVFLNKLGKHATAVFSGEVPSTVEFLQPEKTIKKNTDSLRDFIIALDKSKADKLRYKIEDKYVKIFITPYKTAIGEKDLEFSQGEVNVEVIVALGVHKREDLDASITAHGRILHDATIISVNSDAGTDMGTINWREPKASSLCEMLADLSDTLKPGLLDAQISTAFLTGIVAETNRFSNAKTSAQTMSVSAKLINTGANQQLVATKLEPPEPPAPPPAPKTPPQPSPKPANTTVELPRPTSASLSIPHNETVEPSQTESKNINPDSTNIDSEETPVEQINIDDEGRLLREAELAKQRAAQQAADAVPAAPPSAVTEKSRTVIQPPSPTPPPINEHLDAVRRSVSNALDSPSATTEGMSYEDMQPKDMVEPEDKPSGTPQPRPSDPNPQTPNSMAPPPVPPPLMPGSGTTAL